MQVQDLAEKVGRSVEAEICPKKKKIWENLHPRKLSRQKRKDWLALKSNILEEFRDP